MTGRLEERVVQVRGHGVWTGSIGTRGRDRPTVLMIHGGPAIPHDYLLPLADLAERGHHLVFYDQLGCGRSDRPDDQSLWTIDGFVDEIELVRGALDLHRVVVFGHSCGGVFALSYLARRPDGVVGAILASPVASMAEYTRTTLDQIGPPGDPTRLMIEHHEAAGTTDDPEYGAFLQGWMERHMLRRPRATWPAELERAFEDAGWPVYEVLWNGPQFRSYGPLGEVDLRPAAAQIPVPTLITNGEHDYVTPETGRDLASRMPDARHVEVPDSSHLPWFEQPQVYLDLLDGFLASLRVPEPA